MIRHTTRAERWPTRFDENRSQRPISHAHGLGRNSAEDLSFVRPAAAPVEHARSSNAARQRVELGHGYSARRTDERVAHRAAPGDPFAPVMAPGVLACAALEGVFRALRAPEED